jgi:MinD superfamily P-loop ATPase
VEQYCQRENIKVAAKIPNLKEAAGLYSKGSVLIDKLPEIKREIENIYTYILEIGEEKQ